MVNEIKTKFEACSKCKEILKHPYYLKKHGSRNVPYCSDCVSKKMRVKYKYLDEEAIKKLIDTVYLKVEKD